MPENQITPTIPHQNLFRMASHALLVVLLIAVPAFAQQSTAIQPCTETSTSTKATTAAKRAVVTQTVIDESLTDDAAVEKVIAPYSAKVRALENVIGKLDDDLRKEGVGGGSIGSFVTDGLRAQASRKVGRPVPLMIINSGGLRKNAMSQGDLRAADIFELLPFENVLIQMDFTGEQLMKLLSIVLRRRDAQSGARIRYRINAENQPELISAKLLSPDGSEIEIDRNAIYRIATIDYLLQLASGSYAVLQEGKNVTRLGITIRDAMMEYVKRETAAGRTIKPAFDNRYVLDGRSTTAPKELP